MQAENSNVEERYSPRKDRTAAWLLALLGYFGVFDFYMKHPVKGCVKLSAMIASNACAFLTANGGDGVLLRICHSLEVVFVWNVFDMFLLSRGRYRDGDGRYVKKETRDATVLFWLVIVLPVVIVVFLVVSFLTGTLRLPVA